MHTDEFKEIRVFELLKNQLLLGIITKVKPVMKNVIFEFYANVVAKIDDPASKVFHKVYVRGHLFDFSPIVINEFFESHRPVVEFEADYDVIIVKLTANVQCKWPAAKSFPVVELSLQYSALQRLP